jgi:hypothetical protein
MRSCLNDEPHMTKLLDQALEAVRRQTRKTRSRARCSRWPETKKPEEFDPTHLPDVQESFARAKPAGSLPTPRLKPRSVTSIREASLHPARPTTSL